MSSGTKTCSSTTSWEPVARIPIVRQLSSTVTPSAAMGTGKCICASKASSAARVDPVTPVRDLGIGQRQLVEIARALDGNAKILVLDEPTAALTGTETDRLLEIMASLRGQRTGLVFITHHLQECRRIADRITVLRDGRNVGVLPAGASVTRMIELMVGRCIGEQYPRRTHRPGEVLLTVDRLTKAGVFSDVSFEVRAGEVVGVAGLVGAGRTEVLRAAFGVDRYDSGRVHVVGRPLPGWDVRAAMRAGLGLVPEDRKGQQKVVIGKWLLADPKVLLLDEPTRGVDVGAKVEIYELINRMSAEGRGVLLVSSDLPEVIGMCDRIVVLAHGRVAGELPSGSTQEQVMALAVREPR